jgi:hypothetical protein
MRRPSIVLLAVVLLTLASPAFADPSTATPAPPNGTLTLSLDAAYRFWAARQVQPWPRPALGVYVAVLPPDTLAEALMPGDRVWISSAAWRQVSVDLPHRGDGGDWLMWRRLLQRRFCTLVVHEVGHTAGLDHALTGVMEAEGIAPPPRECGAVFPLGR